MPPRRSGRNPVPALNPEQQTIPLVNRPRNSNTRNMPIANETATNPQAETPPLGVLEDTDEDLGVLEDSDEDFGGLEDTDEDFGGLEDTDEDFGGLEDTDEDLPAFPVASIGSPTVAHPALSHSQPVDETGIAATQGSRMKEPIEGPGWVEWEIHQHRDGDNEFQETLRQAADVGDIFNAKLLEGMGFRGSRVPVDRAPNSGPNSSTIEGSSAVNHNRGAVRHAAGADGLSMSAIGRQTAGVNAPPPSRDEVGRDDNDDAVSIVAIGVQMLSVKEEIIKIMKVGTRPSVIKILHLLKLENDDRSRDLAKLIEERVESDGVEICTAAIPQPISQVAELRGKWGDICQVLGKLDDILEPCIACREVEHIRKLAGPDTSPSAHVFVVYIFERQQAIAGARSRVAVSFRPASSANDVEGNQFREASSSTPSRMNEGDSPLTPTVVNFLEAMIKREDMDAFEKHVLPHRGGTGAYPIIIFARLVESACQRINIPYSTGSDRKKKHEATNGPRISRDDIVLFYGLKSTSEFRIAPSTFANHRSIHMRAQKCIRLLEKKDLSKQDEKNLLRLLKEVIQTPLRELETAPSEGLGSLNMFKARMDKVDRMVKRDKKKAGRSDSE